MESRLVIRRALTFAGVVIVGGACSGRSDADVVPGEAAAAAETAALDVGLFAAGCHGFRSWASADCWRR